MAAAGKNQVTLTFAGDSRDVEQAFDRVGQAARDMESAVESSSRSAADSLDRFGEAADQVDTRAMGFRDSLTGLQDSMLSFGEAAKGNLFEALLLAGFGIGDLASGIFNFAAPALKSLVERVGAAKLALIGLGAAAAGAGLVALLVLGRQAKVTGKDIRVVEEDLRRLVRIGQATVTLKNFFGEGSDAVRQFKSDLDGASNGFFRLTADIGTLGGVLGDRAIDKFNDLDAALARVVDEGGNADAIFRALVTTYGLNAEQVAALRSILPQYAEAQKRAAERTGEAEQASTDAAMALKAHVNNLRDLTDALRAQTDPVFAWIEAQRGARDAQVAVNEAQKEYGARSPQYRDAVLDLAAAQLDLVSATAAVRNATDASLIPALQRLRADGHLSEQAFHAVVAAINETKAAAERLDNTRIRIRGEFIWKNDPPWGGRVPEFHSGGVMPGAPGSEGLALLQAGETIIPPGQGGSAPVVIQAGGSGLDRLFLSYLQGLLRSNNLKLVRA